MLRCLPTERAAAWPRRPKSGTLLPLPWTRDIRGSVHKSRRYRQCPHDHATARQRCRPIWQAISPFLAHLIRVPCNADHALRSGYHTPLLFMSPGTPAAMPRPDFHTPFVRKAHPSLTYIVAGTAVAGLSAVLIDMSCVRTHCNRYVNHVGETNDPQAAGDLYRQQISKRALNCVGRDVLSIEGFSVNHPSMRNLLRFTAPDLQMSSLSIFCKLLILTYVMLDAYFVMGAGGANWSWRMKCSHS